MNQPICKRAIKTIDSCFAKARTLKAAAWNRVCSAKDRKKAVVAVKHNKTRWNGKAKMVDRCLVGQKCFRANEFVPDECLPCLKASEVEDDDFEEDDAESDAPIPAGCRRCTEDEILQVDNMLTCQSVVCADMQRRSLTLAEACNHLSECKKNLETETRAKPQCFQPHTAKCCSLTSDTVEKEWRTFESGVTKLQNKDLGDLFLFLCNFFFLNMSCSP